MGDPAGWPEVIAKSLAHGSVYEICRPVVIVTLNVSAGDGDHEVIEADSSISRVQEASFSERNRLSDLGLVPAGTRLAGCLLFAAKRVSLFGTCDPVSIRMRSTQSALLP